MYKKILVPLDGSDTSEGGLREAMQLAQEKKSSLVLLHVVDVLPIQVELASVASYNETMGFIRTYARKLLADAKELAEEKGLIVSTSLREITREKVGQIIVDEAQVHGCDLIVMGTHGRRGFNRIMMGSDAEYVVRASSTPVLVVRSPTAQ